MSFDAWNFSAIRYHLKRPDEGEGTTEKYGIIDILFVALAKKYCLNKLQITDNIWWYPELRSFQLVAIATTITAFVNRLTGSVSIDILPSYRKYSVKNRPEFTLLTIRFLGLASSSSFLLLSPVLARDVSKRGRSS